MTTEPIRWQTVIADEVLCRVQRLFDAFGTRVEIEKGRGVIRVG